MHWCQIDKKYLDYLRQYENRIPYSDYGLKHYKPFFHSLFKLDNGLEYVAQLNHAQRRHRKMRDMPDFKRVFIPVRRKNGEETKHLAAVLNLNYMFPVPSELLRNVYPSNIDKVRSFTDEKEKSKYIDLLNKEMIELNNMKLERKAKKLYSLKNDYPDNVISKRCFDYKSLELVALNYK